MKRLLLMPLLALPLIAQPVPNAYVTATARVGAVYESDLSFQWCCESTNTEHSVGDTTATMNNGCVLTNSLPCDGLNSLFSGTNYDYADFTVSSGDLMDEDLGTIVFWCNVNTLVDYTHTITLYGDTTNYISVQLRTGNKVRLRHYAGGTDRYTSDSAATFSSDTWFKVTAKWRRGAAPYLSIGINNEAPTEYSTSDLGVMNTSPTQLRIGEYATYDPVMKIDSIRIWKVWK